MRNWACPPCGNVVTRRGCWYEASPPGSYSMGVASLSALIYDPATGSQTNIDIAHFSNSDSTATVSDPTSAAVEGVVGFTGLGIEIGGFRANLSEGALFFGGQSATQGNFSVNSLNVPRFQ